MMETFVHQALVVGRAVDVHGRAVGGLTLVCDRANTGVRVASGGEFVVAGDAARVFPNLANAPDSLQVVLSAPARAEHPLDVTIPQGANLPVDVGNVALPAVPVSLAGRVRRRDLSQAAIADAFVAYVPDAAVPGLVPLALRAPVATAHPAASEVRAAAVAPTAAATTCPGGARAGEHLLVASSTVGIGAGTVLRFTPGEREHYAVVAEVVAGHVVLETPLTVSIPPGGEVRAVSATATGPTRALARDAQAGDGLLTLDADLVGDAARIVDLNTNTIEVYAVGARTDAAGVYRLAGVRGVPAVAVKATATGLAGTQDPTVWRVDERADPNLLDLTVQP